MSYRKKLIEVAMPLDALSNETAREKTIRDGHPSTMHLWWARRPLAACRTVLFAQLVDDPSAWPSLFPTPEDQSEERHRLFDLMTRIASWGNIHSSAITDAQREIARSFARGRVADGVLDSVTQEMASAATPSAAAVREFLHANLPEVFDPFSGGGSIPLEAQRLGLRSVGADLNPVAAIISSLTAGLPTSIRGMPPKHPGAPKRVKESYRNAEGLAEDVRYYGDLLFRKVRPTLAEWYQEVSLPKSSGGGSAPVVAWLWARTIRSPNPAMRETHVPLLSTYWLCSKPGKEAWLSPVVDAENRRWSFEVRVGKPPSSLESQVDAGTKSGRGQYFCLLSGTSTTIPAEYYREEGRAGRLGVAMIAVIAKGKRQRIYLPASAATVPALPTSTFLEEVPLAEISGYLNPPLYGIDRVGKMFLPRQRLTLERLCALVPSVFEEAVRDGCPDWYARLIADALTLGVGRQANRLTTLCVWHNGRETVEHTFSEQGIAMTSDFAEANPLSGATGSWEGSFEYIPRCIEELPVGDGHVELADAERSPARHQGAIFSTDPPYFSSITYADFSDFFYGLFRRCLKPIRPEFFATIATPKQEEAVAAWHRFGGDRAAASQHFQSKLSACFRQIAQAQSSDFPLTIFYAFKSTETEGKDESLITAWESILKVLVDNDMTVVATWPLRTELVTGRKGRKNVLASSIVLACRARSKDSLVVSRADFLRDLRRSLANVVNTLKQENIAPVDLQQSVIGPGMTEFSKHKAVIEANGTPMSVRSALDAINESVDSIVSEQGADLDPASRFAATWFETYCWEKGPHGEAEKLAQARNISLASLEAEGWLVAAAQKVWLTPRSEFKNSWSPAAGKPVCVWQATQHLIRRLEDDGEEAAARLLATLGAHAESVRELAYRLHARATRKSWNDEARSLNGLVVAWAELEKLARGQPKLADEKGQLGLGLEPKRSPAKARVKKKGGK